MKNRVKKGVTVVLLLILMVLLAGCKKNNTEDMVPEPPEEITADASKEIITEDKPEVLPTAAVKTMSDMPGMNISSDFSVRVRPAGGNEWTEVKVFSFTSHHVNHMARITADCTVEIEITNLKGDISAYKFEPKRYETTPVISGNKLTFTADPIQKYAIQFDDTGTWFILAVEPYEEEVPGPKDDNVVNVMDFVADNTGNEDVYAGIDAAINYLLETPGKEIIYFPDGIYRTHSIELSLVENVAFYLCEGARIMWDENCWGSNIFRLSGCNNIKFYGRGIIDGTYRIHAGRGSSGIGWWDGINLTHLSGRLSNGLIVDGLWFFDMPNSPMRSEGGNNAVFYNTKYINYGGYQNDNFIVYGGTNIVFDEGIGTGDDDAWSAHTAAWGGFTDTNNVTIKNSTYIADGVHDRGGLCYGCNESNPEGGSTLNVIYENLSLIEYGQALDSYNAPINGMYGNFLLRNVQFESSTSLGVGFDNFRNLSGTIILDQCSFVNKGGTIAGNPSNEIVDLYINDLMMEGRRITSPEEGNITITNVKNVHWDSELPEAFDTPEPVEPPETIPQYSLPISDDFNNGTYMNWTDLSGSQNNTCKVSIEDTERKEDKCMVLYDTESSGVSGIIKRFTPQGQDMVVTIGMDIKTSATNKISSIYINDRVGAIAAGVRFYNNGKIRYFGTKGSDFEVGSDISSYKANTWYHLKWIFDVGLQRYDLYIGEGKGVVPETKTLGNVPFKCELPNIASVRMDTESIWLAYSGQTNIFYVDNVQISSQVSDQSLFDKNNTEITFGEAQETYEYINNNAIGIEYVGSWSLANNRGMGDYNNDVHYSTIDGDYVEYSFTGTGITFITETNNDEGTIDVFIDEVLQTTIDCKAGARAVQQEVYTISGLTESAHKIKLVKKSGEYMLVDAFMVIP
ncbi:MAG: hypothetical protein K0S76_860 [Herbinix sp.]|jgi:hypothetical protein|nr:hypothetical protein [Herbinix sp.]